MPRSLNDPVGFAPSYFSHTVPPTRSDNRGAGSSGVPPSRSVTTGVSSPTGRNARYSSTTPRQAIALLRPHHADEAADAVDDVEAAQTGDGRLHGPLARGVGDEHQLGLI